MDEWILRNLVFCAVVVVGYLYLSSKNEAPDTKPPQVNRKKEAVNGMNGFAQPISTGAQIGVFYDHPIYGFAQPISTGAQIGVFHDRPIFEWIVVDGKTYDYDGITGNGKQITYTLRKENP